MVNKDQLKERSQELNIPILEKVPKVVSKRFLNILSEDIARENKTVVFDGGEGIIRVAMVDPSDPQALNVLGFVAGKNNLKTEIYLISEDDLDELLKNYETAEKAIKDVVQSFESDREEAARKEDSKEDSYQKIIQDAPVSKLTKVVIGHAIEGRASDIHIEPSSEGYRVRYRVDGVLHSSLVIPREVGKAIVSRIKILSNLKIDETRKPQDGRFSFAGKMEGDSIDFRVSTFPVVGGEKVVLRILEKGGKVLELEELGLLGRNNEILTEAIKENNGIILMTGPTGSGKSTTLYALLQIINNEERNIVTLEDPVEYSVEGINQSQIKPEIGYTFSSGLRSILRQDPNVIMVGEIRDAETAELAIHASLTGHLVFSTLHTNDAIGSVVRLVDMGIEPFLLASSLRVLAAQRLVRKICQKCKTEEKLPTEFYGKIKTLVHEIEDSEIKKYGIDLSKGIKFYYGAGCEECGNTGLKGRLAIYECFNVDNDARDAITSTDRDRALRNVSNKQKMLSMKQDGILKALLGMTTLAEVERITEGSLTVGGAVEDDKG
ncbi:MAG: GspE/PulE family protein [Candidatus Moranbacteria bacterium]|nr:GspE/PulE family protein [Candidatus Moranbacteria bacterium]